MTTPSVRSFLLGLLLGACVLDGAAQPQASTPTLRRPAVADTGTSPLTFLAVGDWGWRGEKQQQPVADQMAATARTLGAHFVISTGDNFYYDGVTSTSDSHFDESFEQVYDAPSLQVPWYISLGNHDYSGDPTTQIAYSSVSDRWTLPDRYYSVTKVLNDTTRAQFIILDSELVGKQATKAGIDPGAQW